MKLPAKSRTICKVNFHYDMPIEVFRLHSRPDDEYSSGFWDADHPTLEAAQTACLRPGHGEPGAHPDSHVLDVGYGWGAFALFCRAATGCRVTGLASRPDQQAYVQARARAAGVADRLDFPARPHPGPARPARHVQPYRLLRDAVSICA